MRRDNQNTVASCQFLMGWGLGLAAFQPQLNQRKQANQKGWRMKSKLSLQLSCAVALLAGSAQAATITIGAYNFDLDQFVGADVATNSTFTSSNQLDQLLQFDPYAVGDMVTSSTGDVVSLGDHDTQESLLLTYDTGFYVGSGMSSLFVVYEGTSATPTSGPDAEGTAFDIRFNGAPTWVSASNNIGANVLSFSTNKSDYPNQNQIVFDLTSANFGFAIGDLITSVEIRNRMGTLVGSFDPDFTFIAHAGTSTPPVVPLPAPAAMGLVGLILAGLVKRRKSNSNA